MACLNRGWNILLKGTGVLCSFGWTTMMGWWLFLLIMKRNCPSKLSMRESGHLKGSHLNVLILHQPKSTPCSNSTVVLMQMAWRGPWVRFNFSIFQQVPYPLVEHGLYRSWLSFDIATVQKIRDPLVQVLGIQGEKAIWVSPKFWMNPTDGKPGGETPLKVQSPFRVLGWVESHQQPSIFLVQETPERWSSTNNPSFSDNSFLAVLMADSDQTGVEFFFECQANFGKTGRPSAGVPAEIALQAPFTLCLACGKFRDSTHVRPSFFGQLLPP